MGQSVNISFFLLCLEAADVVILGLWIEGSRSTNREGPGCPNPCKDGSVHVAFSYTKLLRFGALPIFTLRDRGASLSQECGIHLDETNEIVEFLVLLLLD